jgi:hypothetical protein
LCAAWPPVAVRASDSIACVNFRVTMTEVLTQR